jgi:hypothetical protein
MSFDWSNFLAVADALAIAEWDVNREASLRTAIGRAYYAAFGVARLGARSIRLATRRSAAEHGEVAAFYATVRRTRRANRHGARSPQKPT